MWEWVFDGIGTELVSLGIGAVAGGLAGYKIGVTNKVKQVQKAGDDANQKQIFKTGIKGEGNNTKQKTKIKQVQKAGSNATQVQVGGSTNEQE